MVTLVGESSYFFSLANCQANNEIIMVANIAQVIFAALGRLKTLQSRNQPQKKSAIVAAIPEVKAPSVRARTEKYLVKYMFRYVPFQL